MNTTELVAIISDLKANAKAKFDETINAVLELDLNPQKDSIRGSIIVPHSVAKPKKVCVLTDDHTSIEGADVFNEEILTKIQSGEKFLYDVCLTDSKFFPKLKTVAKTLSKSGLMPSIKDQTVTNSLIEAVESIQSGKKLNFKNDSAGYLHIIIGKVSNQVDDIIANLRTIVEHIKTFNKTEKNKNFIKSIKLSTTMGKGSQLVTVKDLLQK